MALSCALAPLVAANLSATRTAHPPAGFQPSSVSFISPTTGFVLGASPCGQAQCAALLETTDGGRSWARLGAPAVALSGRPDPEVSPPSSVQEVVFANAADGWAYGPGLWSTTDGGRTWHEVKLGLQVAKVAVYGKEAFAEVWHCQGASEANCSESLERSSVGSSTWATVPGLPGAWAWGALAGYGASVWVVMPSRGNDPEALWHSTDAGASWRKLPGCPHPVITDALAAMAAVSSTSLFEVCVTNSGAGQQGKSLRFSGNAGASSVQVSKLVGWGGYVSSVAAANTSDVAISATSNLSFLYGSLNGGKSWKVLALPDGGAGLDDLQFARPRLLAVVDAYPAAPGSQAGPAAGSRLLLSRDGGASWATVTFRAQ
jgi:photosystem II stability/assembly factor-like uncharacterized protein